MTALDQDSQGIPYSESDNTRIVRPDFVFFAEQDRTIVVDIIDPHGFHLVDVLPTLQGLAHYAETHSQTYRHNDAVAEVGGQLRALNLIRADVRQAVMEAKSTEALYKYAITNDYPQLLLLEGRQQI